jgi:glyoxylase-like metal-dependent hydrolase (beta-lactamase superfamily II)
MAPEPRIEALFDKPTSTISYLVGDPTTREAAVIDPILDFDIASGEVDTRSVERILAFAAAHGWRIAMVVETHAHADHLSGAPLIKARTGAWLGIGEHIRDVQKIFRPLFALDDVETNGSDFDRLFADRERFPIGALEVEVMHVPGHPPADIAYRIGDTAFVGDTLFMPDYGTARADFPGGDARILYRSIRRVLSLPAETRPFIEHLARNPGLQAGEVSESARRALLFGI